MTNHIVNNYGDFLNSFMADAKANQQAARETLDRCVERREDAEEHIRTLDARMAENLKMFKLTAKRIQKMVRNRPENPSELDEAIQPVLGYKDALVALPEAHRECIVAIEAEHVAKEEANRAARLCDLILEINTLKR